MYVIPNTYKNSFWFFSETWSSSFCIVCNCFDDFRPNLLKNIGQFHRKENSIFQNDFVCVPRFQKCLFELSFAFFFGCNYKNCFEIFLRTLYLEQYLFFVQMQSHVSAKPVLEGYVWYFGSLDPAFEMTWDIEYLQKQLLFLEQNRNFPKRRWVLSRNVFLSSAQLDSLVVTK